MKRAALTFTDRKKAEPYIDALRYAGIDPVFVTPEEPLESLIGVEGLVLSGGTDLDPRLYSQEPNSASQSPDPARDKMEQRLLREALESDLPVLAICRGLQMFNVTHEGGTLSQHIDGHRVRSDPSLPAHDVIVEESTLLAKILGAGSHAVNSRHHQAVAQVGRGLTVSAKSAGDGVVEGLERPDRRFAIAVQWHPEDQIHRSPEQQKLFDAFRDALG